MRPSKVQLLMTRADVSSMNKTDYAHAEVPSSRTQVNHSVQRRCSCAGAFPRHRHVLRHLGIWLQEGGKTQQGTGNREEEEKEEEEDEEDGRQADADEAIYSGTEGGRVSRARWFDECVNNTGWVGGGGGMVSGENQEQQCKVSVVVGGKTQPRRDWLSVLRPLLQPQCGGQRSPDMTPGVLLRSTVFISVVCVGRRRPTRNRNKQKVLGRWISPAFSHCTISTQPPPSCFNEQFPTNKTAKHSGHSKKNSFQAKCETIGDFEEEMAKSTSHLLLSSPVKTQKETPRPPSSLLIP